MDETNVRAAVDDALLTVPGWDVAALSVEDGFASVELVSEVGWTANFGWHTDRGQDEFATLVDHPSSLTRFYSAHIHGRAITNPDGFRWLFTAVRESGLSEGRRGQLRDAIAMLADFNEAELDVLDAALGHL